VYSGLKGERLMRYDSDGFDYYDSDAFDYDSLARDCDDLYSCDEEYDEYDEETVSHSDWENYYHNLTEEIDD
jgi:hypothetical protein